MYGTYPFIIDGREQGSLSVSPAGGYTLFTIDCAMQHEVIRVSVYGEGREGYLGVPAPHEGRMRLEKKFSPAAMADFPAKIDHAGLAGERQYAAEPAPVTEAVSLPGTAPEPAPEAEETGVIWYAASDGALVGRDGERDYVALLPEDPRVPPDYPAEQRIIEGQEYLVYISQD